LPIEIVEHDAGLDDAGAVFDIDRDELVQMLRQVDDDAFVYRLPTLRGAAAARRNYASIVTADRHGA